MGETFDLIIRNGTVLDGTGAPGRQADVGVRGDRIAAVGALAAASAVRVVDAAGWVVSPGFIDAHSHSDTFFLIEPDAPSKVTQGVTTEIVGQCGASAAPIFGQGRLPSDWAALVYPERRCQASGARDQKAAGGESRKPSPATNHLPPSSAPGPTWSTVAEYREIFEQVRPAVNAVLLIGHNTLRAGVMGYEPRTATADEVSAMQRHLTQALDEGGSGMSTGLIYQPGRYATPEEVLALAKTTAAHGGCYATHMRSEGDRLLEALDEVLQLGHASGIRLQISHLKTSSEQNWGKLDAVFAQIEAAQRQGVCVHADRYPYLAGGTDLDVVLPDWAAAGGRDAILARLADDATRARMAAELDSSRTRNSWDGVMIGGTTHPELHALRGQTIAAIAAARGGSAGEAVVWILQRDALRTGAFFFGMSGANLRRIYAQPWVMVGSDASLRAPEGPLAADHPHPRAYGTFPRFLRLVQDENLMPLPEAIRRITSLPADAFGLRDRGRIKAGAFADLAVFNPAAMRDAATFAAPHVFSSGVRQVWVNGRCCYDHGRFTGDRGGRVLQSRF
ncbi:MAG: D-aminoacylase [bacterium]